MWSKQYYKYSKHMQRTLKKWGLNIKTGKEIKRKPRRPGKRLFPPIEHWGR